MKSEGGYNFRKKGNELIFETTSYSAEKSSVLHSGVYSREFSSMLLASALCLGIFVASGYIIDDAKLARFVTAIIFFIPLFFLSRKTLFRDRILKLIMDGSSNTVLLSKPGILLDKQEKIPFGKIASIEVGSKRFAPDNPDAVQFVQKISAQHGSPVPGLGDVEEYVTLSLKLTDGSEKVIFACRIEEEPELPVNEMRRFLGGFNA
jgi:hypothetical protein